MLDFQSRFGGASSTAAPASTATGTRRDLPKATSWVNIGVSVPVDVTDAAGNTTSETRFVSLPVGIPLDTMEPIAINSRNQDYAQFQSARNDLLEQLKALATSLNPGEERTIALEVQVRRVNEAAPVPAADESNPYAIKINVAS